MSESALAPQVAEAPAQYGAVPQGQVLVDSGPLLALFNGADHWHARVVAWLQAHPALGLVSTWPVLTEVCALLARRVHNQAALDFLLWVERGGVRVDTPADISLSQMRRISQRFASLPLDLRGSAFQQRVWQALRQVPASLPLDLADASIVEAAERLGIRRIVSIDADFDVYRDARGKPLANLLRS